MQITRTLTRFFRCWPLLKSPTPKTRPLIQGQDRALQAAFGVDHTLRYFASLFIREPMNEDHIPEVSTPAAGIPRFDQIIMPSDFKNTRLP